MRHIQRNPAALNSHNVNSKEADQPARESEWLMARGRTAGFQMGAEHRTKIANSKILKHLIEHAEGSREMSSTQVTAALGLLDRVMPKLQSVDPETGQGGVTIHLPKGSESL